MLALSKETRIFSIKKTKSFGKKNQKGRDGHGEKSEVLCFSRCNLNAGNNLAHMVIVILLKGCSETY